MRYADLLALPPAILAVVLHMRRGTAMATQLAEALEVLPRGRRTFQEESRCPGKIEEGETDWGQENERK
jgi:hypothetical protein